MRTVALVPVLLAAGVPAQNTWVVNAGGTGDFPSLFAAEAAAAPGDTLILQGSLVGVPLTKALHLVAHGSVVSSNLIVSAPGALSISGGTFTDIRVAGTSVSLDGVTTSLRVQAGTVAARGCTFAPGSFTLQGALVDGGARAVFDGCSFVGRNAAAAFGAVASTAALQVAGRAEVRNCTIAGGLEFTIGSFTMWGSPAVDLWNGSVDLRSCTLSSGLGAPRVGGAGLLRTDNTATAGATPPPATVTIVAAALPWTTGVGALPGGLMHADVDGPATTLAVMFGSLGMRPPIASPFGDIWVDESTEVALVFGITSGTGQLATTIAVPPQVQRGLQVTCQTLLLASGGALATTSPAILQVR